MSSYLLKIAMIALLSGSFCKANWDRPLEKQISKGKFVDIPFKIDNESQNLIKSKEHAAKLVRVFGEAIKKTRKFF